jgi:hypothetical protein
MPRPIFPREYNMPILRIRLEKEITTAQAEKLTRVVRMLRPDLVDSDEIIMSDLDLSLLVAGMVAGNIDKLLGDPLDKFSATWRTPQC